MYPTTLDKMRLEGGGYQSRHFSQLVGHMDGMRILKNSSCYSNPKVSGMILGSRML